MKDVLKKLLISSRTKASKDEFSEILEWVKNKNENLKVNIRKNKLSESVFWFYDEEKGVIRNKNNSFFSIAGLRQYKDEVLVLEQPILIQDEIGYLGIICKEIDGVLHFLMQAKIEPGNVNKIQISPTIQATKSNFTQMHGGKRPAYLEYFLSASCENILFDQIQSEQSSRFLGKRNRNIVIFVDEDIEVLPSHRFMTLGTIRQLMKIDNLVNMDTRTVLSCIPYSLLPISEKDKHELSSMFDDVALFNSIFGETNNENFVKVYNTINDFKMLSGFKNETVPLNKLQNWSFTDEEIVCKDEYPFKVIFCDIEIEGREVTRWTQPLFEAVGMATFGLIVSNFNDKTHFLVHLKHEVGCFDKIELAPTVQLEASANLSERDEITERFFVLLESGAQKLTDVILSEEGGRFYCEQNKNIIIKVAKEDVGELPDGYFWLDYKTLNRMVQYNNVLNIQLRNLISLLNI